jgi:hypothetical protein
MKTAVMLLRRSITAAVCAPDGVRLVRRKTVFAACALREQRRRSAALD